MSGVYKRGQKLPKNTLMIRRRVSSSFSKKSDSEKRLSRATIRLIDESGIDLTPLPLLSEEKRIHDDKDTMSADISQSSNLGGSSLHITNPFTFTRSYISGSSPTGESHSETSEEHDRYQTFTEVKTLIQPNQESLTEIDLNKLINIIIAETETFWVFDQPPKFIPEDSIHLEEQLKQNEIYKTLITSKIGNDRFIERGMNTFNLPLMNKFIQTDYIKLQDKSCMASNWDIIDTYEKEIEEEETKRNVLTDKSYRNKVGINLNKNKLDTSIKSALNDKNILLQSDDGGPLESKNSLMNSLINGKTKTSQEFGSTQYVTNNTMNTNSESDLTLIHDNSITQLNQLTNELGLLETAKMKNDLNNMERALNINIYRDKLFKYQSLLLKECQSNMNSCHTMKLSPEFTQTLTNDTSNDIHLTGHESSLSKVSMSTLPITIISNMISVNSTRSTINDDNTIIRSSELSTNKHNISPQIPHVIPLWRFQCSMTKGHNISDMAWNKQNPNILAIGYGQFDYDNQQKGLICCWSLKLIEYPERYYETPSSVTAIGWSKIHANLLAVGMFNGVVFIYDVRKNDPLPVIDTTHASGRHLGPVRKLQWIFKESGLAENLQEVLVSVSNDGRVTQWFIRKGFESADLMVLKQSYSNVLTPMNTSQRNEALISRTAFATSMAFNKRELNIYVVGTENGPIYKCSYSYNEQYLDTYIAHSASVYQIEWSPFVPEIFLSCSADMTIRLWHLDYQKPLITIQRNMTTIPSISWSPHNSLIFASIAEGVLEIWNLDYSTVDPYITETISTEANMTSVLFSETSQSVLIGDDQGTVHVYTLTDFPYSLSTKSEQ
ncbi:WD repeat-containing protein 78, partial [Schistosoma haematobium]